MKKIGYLTVAIFVLAVFAACYSEIEDDPRQPGDLLPIAGAYNVRDLGGYAGADGKHVKYGKLIRAGSLDLLTSRDQNRLFGEIGVKTVVDFRSKRLVIDSDLEKVESERDGSKDKLPDDVTVEWQNTAIDEQLVIPDYETILSNRALSSPFDVENAVVEGYKAIVVGKSGYPSGAQTQYKAFFDTLLNSASVGSSDPDPVLFHCSAGKDRTGVAAALLLSALGVDREIIIQDYVASAEYVAEKYYPVGPYVAQAARDNIKGIRQLAQLWTAGGDYAAQADAALTASTMKSEKRKQIQTKLDDGNTEEGARAAAETWVTGPVGQATINGTVAGTKSAYMNYANITDEQIEQSAREASAKVQPLLTVRREYIRAAFNAIEAATYTDTTVPKITAYLKEKIGLSDTDIQRLQSLYLEP